MFADRELSWRLERAEAHGGTGFVDARARVHPGCGAEWKEVAGAYAIFDGRESPINQTFGLGLLRPVTPADLAEIERFFADRGCTGVHEISPFADLAVWPLLCERGYRPVEFTSVLFLPLANRARGAPAANPNLRVGVAPEDRHIEWVLAAMEAWRPHVDAPEPMGEMMRVSLARTDAEHFLCELDGRVVATASLCFHEGVALLAGAATIPEARKQGAQRALLESRLQYATELGCDLAMMGAEPGSASQRNAERQGFRIAYTRTKWGGGDSIVEKS
jgi:GNAT superfamily N-acetyltransferase